MSGSKRVRRGSRIAVGHGLTVTHVGAVAEGAELMGYLNQQRAVDLLLAPRKQEEAEFEEETSSCGIDGGVPQGDLALALAAAAQQVLTLTNKQVKIEGEARKSLGTALRAKQVRHQVSKQPELLRDLQQTSDGAGEQNTSNELDCQKLGHSAFGRKEGIDDCDCKDTPNVSAEEKCAEPKQEAHAVSQAFDEKSPDDQHGLDIMPDLVHRALEDNYGSSECNAMLDTGCSTVAKGPQLLDVAPLTRDIGRDTTTTTGTPGSIEATSHIDANGITIVSSTSSMRKAQLAQ
ncbi:unnamed protein product, partial [Prorocentrum cordatum]